MKPDIHMMTATTLSMVITFTFYYCLEGTSLNNSLFQDILVDPTRDYLLFIRCLLHNGQIYDTCKHYCDNITLFKVFIIYLIISLCDIKTKYHSESVKKNAKLVAFTLIVVWFTARFFNALSLSCPIDVLTVFFVFWQLVYLIGKWHAFELPYFSYTLHQVSLCIFTAFVSYIAYDIGLRYLPIQCRFIFLWSHAVMDCYINCVFYVSIACLYVHGHLYNESSIIILPLTSPFIDDCLFTPGIYYVDDPRDEEIDDEPVAMAPGLGDFIFYNLMVLFILSPLLSMVNQIYVAIGAIISVQIGYTIMHWTSILRNKNDILPGLPLPIIFYSTYAVLLDIFTQYFNSDIC